ncbi:MAG: tyrosine--tRNA ligase, partial [Eubacteriaceae bacterium]|nr:tyrosine--tRNA ligase [Eubacteriaceae bacterium]
RRLVEQGGVTLNGEKVESKDYTLSDKDFSQGYALLKKGKKIFHKLAVK